MSYETALKWAGAEVHCFECFGSYQGDWWAKVTYKGETGWVTGSYGSCSGCDAFESEFGYGEGGCDNPHYSPVESCDACKESAKVYAEKLAEFGKGYLDDLVMSQADAEKKAEENIEWDSDAEPMLKWIKDNA